MNKTEILFWKCTLLNFFSKITQEADDELFPKDAEGNLEFAPECDYVDTWKAFEEAMDLGLTKAIGLSNFNHKQIERILAVARIKPSYLQVYYTDMSK